MCAKDVRAVENPISAIFDLAEDVNVQAPKVRKLMKYATVFTCIWLFVDFLFMVAMRPPTFPFLIILFLLLLSMRWIRGNVARIVVLTFVVLDFVLLSLIFWEASPLLGLILAALFVLGMLILNLISELTDFFKYYVLRHRAIKSVRDEDPVAYVPEGKSSVDRLVSYLSAKSPRLREARAKSKLIQKPGILKGETGMLYSFDYFVHSKPSMLWKLFGMGDRGYALYIKGFERKPGVKDLEAMRRAVEDISEGTGVPPSRVIALWMPPKDESIDDAAYNYLTGKVVEFKHMGKSVKTTIELITEKPDKTYDFIPFVSNGVA